MLFRSRLDYPSWTGTAARSVRALGQADAATVAEVNAAAGRLTEGEVHKIDKDAGKLAIKHGPIQNLNMPTMTMAYQVKDSLPRV